MIVLSYVLVVIVILAVLYVSFKLIMGNRPAPNACPRCEGKGYWLGTRERERCDRCKGTGLL